MNSPVHLHLCRSFMAICMRVKEIKIKHSNERSNEPNDNHWITLYSESSVLISFNSKKRVKKKRKNIDKLSYILFDIIIKNQLECVTNFSIANHLKILISLCCKVYCVEDSHERMRARTHALIDNGLLFAIITMNKY